MFLGGSVRIRCLDQGRRQIENGKNPYRAQVDKIGVLVYKISTRSSRRMDEVRDWTRFSAEIRS